jgi:membrane protein required for beta-lactamase induction
VDVELLDDGSALASWVELVGTRGEFRVRRLESSGKKSCAGDDRALCQAAARAVFLALLGQGKKLAFAWTESMGNEEGAATYQVRTATATLP